MGHWTILARIYAIETSHIARERKEHRDIIRQFRHAARSCKLWPIIARGQKRAWGDVCKRKEMINKDKIEKHEKIGICTILNIFGRPEDNLLEESNNMVSKQATEAARERYK